MHVDEVELRLIRLPFKSVFKTSFAAETEKHAVIITVRSEGVEGYGESVMDTLPSYREESIVGALHLIREALAPSLLNNDVDEPSSLVESWKGWRGNPMAKSALELAVWDCHARQLDVPLRTLLGGQRTEIPVGASLGMSPVPETVAAVAQHVDQGYKRIKLKIEPGWDVNILTAVRAEFPDIELTVDANSAYTLDDLDVLKQIDQFDLHYIEQPLHWDDLVDHATLAPQLQTPLCLDETLTSPARVKAALDLKACSVVNIKVGRVGGLAATTVIHDHCVERGVPMWCGGMLETGIGRAHNIHVATMPGFVYPGDTASASRTYARDITEQALEATDGIMPVPPGAGLGVTLDRAFLETVTESVDDRAAVSIQFRELRTAAELAPMPALESRVWGGSDLIAVNMLVATISEGGMAIGAFDGDRLVGSVYGFATHQPHVLHSHYLAVDPDYRRTGLGVALKHEQRGWCLANGRTAMRWTFDPLQLGNAHLNLRSLRAICAQYYPDFYGPMGGINGGLPSDRLVVEWDLVGRRFAGIESVQVDVPPVTGDEIARATAAALHARVALRDAMCPLFAEGWKVTDIDLVGRTYTLSR